MTKTILVTGGTSYIGSHTVKALLNAGYKVHVLDNLSTGNRAAVGSRASFKELDVYDASALKAYLEENQIDAVLHYAGEIVVSESIENPSKYFTANVAGMDQVLKVLSEVGIQKIMFSSTVSLYGNNCIDKPVTEDTLLDPVNPYAETKLMGERMIYWMANRYDWKYVIFRYFNVAGAEMDASNGLRVKNPTHIIPNINKTALGQNDSLKIFGDDYDTRDGSCIRDYIYVLHLQRETAQILGLDVEKEQKELLWGIVLLTSTATALVGPMAFFGFMLANLTYLIVKDYQHKLLFIVAILVGFISLTLGQALIERVFALEIRISMIIESVGGFLFFILLYRRSRQ